MRRAIAGSQRDRTSARCSAIGPVSKTVIWVLVARSIEVMLSRGDECPRSPGPGVRGIVLPMREGRAEAVFGVHGSHRLANIAAFGAGFPAPSLSTPARRRDQLRVFPVGALAGASLSWCE